MAIIYKVAGEGYGAIGKNVPILPACGLFNALVRLKLAELVQGYIGKALALIYRAKHETRIRYSGIRQISRSSFKSFSPSIEYA